MLLSRSLQRARHTINLRRRIHTSPLFHKMAPTPSLPSDTRPIVISGPSGVGKGTLYKKLMNEYPSTFATSISHTTRDPRPGEERDVDYYYVSMGEFEDLIKEDGFVEHAKFGGNRYGTSKKMIREMEASGRIVVLDIEMEGVKQIKNSSIAARYVFIAPPSMQELESRLRGRGTEKEDSIVKRLAQAKNELDYSKTEGVHDVIIVNEDLEKAFVELKDFVWGRTTQKQDAADAGKAGVSVQD